MLNEVYMIQTWGIVGSNPTGRFIDLSLADKTPLLNGRRYILRVIAERPPLSCVSKASGSSILSVKQNLRGVDRNHRHTPFSMARSSNG